MALSRAIPFAGPVHRSQRFYDASLYVGAFSNPAGQLIGANVLYAVPFRADAVNGYDQIGIKNTAAGAGGTLHRLSVLTDGANGWPDLLLADSGTFAADDTSEHMISVTIPTVRNRWYWLAFQSNSAGSVLSMVSNNCNPLGGFTSGSDAVHSGGLFVARAFAAIAASVNALGWAAYGLPQSIRLRAL